MCTDYGLPDVVERLEDGLLLCYKDGLWSICIIPGLSLYSCTDKDVLLIHHYMQKIREERDEVES